MQPQTNGWQFWLDVGGTFTDCLARTPDGQLRRRKVLSSGVVKGHAATESTVESIVDHARCEPDGFWIGYKLGLLSTLIDVGRLIVQLEWDGVRAADASVATPLVTPHSPRGGTPRMERGDTLLEDRGLICDSERSLYPAHR